MSSVPVKNPKVLFRITTGDPIMLVDLELNDFFWELDGIAGDLWKEMDGVKTWQEIKDLHRKNFCEDGDFDQMSDRLLQELIEADIILFKK